MVRQEKKNPWSFRLYESLRGGVEQIVAEEYRGDRALAGNIAALMLVLATREERERYADCLARATVRGYEGTVLDAARRVFGRAIGAEADDKAPPEAQPRPADGAAATSRKTRKAGA